MKFIQLTALLVSFAVAVMAIVRTIPFSTPLED
jgi:hypothetical protein